MTITFEQEVKRCTGCKEVKLATPDFFYKNYTGSTVLRAKRKKCLNKIAYTIEAKRKIIDEEFRLKLLARNKLNRSSEEYKTSSRAKNLFKKYGLTVQQYAELFYKQNGACAICKISQLKLKKRLFADHCNATGMIRGLLCSKCNHALGLLNDDEYIILRAAEYIKNAKVK